MSNYEQWQVERFGNIVPEFQAIIPNEGSSCDDEDINYSIAKIIT